MVTKHKVRSEDKYDVPILYWKDANLTFASTARVSKATLLSKSDFIFKIGDLNTEDLKTIEKAYEDFKNGSEE